MYTDGAQTTGHHRFLQHINTSAPCPCQHCVHCEQPAYSHHGGLGYHHHHLQQQHRPASARQTDHPSLDLRRDTQAPPAKDVVGRAFLVDRVERSGHRSPQRRPVFSLHSDDLSQVCPWELNPAQWSYAPEPGLRHYTPVREQCGCVTHGDARAQPFTHGIPHPLPHLQVKGQGYRHRRTVRYISVDEEEETCGCTSEYYHAEPHSLHLGHIQKPNGHCGGARPPVFFEGGEEGDRHQDRVRQGGSEEHCNGRSDPHKAFFPTEVPQKHLNQSRQKGPYIPPPSITSPEPSRPTATEDDGHRRQAAAAAEAARQRRRQETVRDQIRQVVTDLEDVLGGLKQVHVEMKEVVEQIDRLTASIDLSEEPPCITQGSYANSHGPVHPGDLRLALPFNHKPPPSQTPQHVDEDRIILRTNTPSPIHMASVVKTSRFTPPVITKDNSQERTGMNGHPPQLHPPRDSNHVGQTHPEPHPQSLDPKVIINNSTSNSRTQKPPLYPQNGRCGKGMYPPSKPARSPAYPGRGRHNTSMV